MSGWYRAFYFYDGSAEFLEAVVEYYDGVFGFGFDVSERVDLVEYFCLL